MNYSSPVFRNRIRLIKPCRTQAPTEYNLQYRKWPLRPFAFDTFWTGTRRTKTKAQSAASSVLESYRSFSSSYPESTVGSETSNSLLASHADDASLNGDSGSIDCHDERDALNKDYAVESTLKTRTAKIHDRPGKKTSVRFENRKAVSPLIVSKESSSIIGHPAREFGDGLNRLNAYAAKSCPCEVEEVPRSKTFPSNCEKSYRNSKYLKQNREAWSTAKVNESQSAPSHYVDEPSGAWDNDLLRIRDLYRALENINPVELSKSKVENPSYFNKLPSKRSVGNTESVSAPKTPDKKTSPTNKNKNRQKRSYSIHGVDQASLKKLYANLPLSDINRVHELIDKNKETEEDDRTLLAQEDIKLLQQETAKPSNLPLQWSSTTEWHTSYNMDFRNWHLQEAAQEVVTSKTDPIIPEVNNEEKVQIQTAVGKENMKKQCAEQVAAHKAESKNEAQSQRWENKKMANEIKDRLMQEASQLENAEYESLFRKDGRPKMKSETTSSAFKVWKPKTPEVPLWADKTMISLGSGFWNLPMCKNENWALRAKIKKKHEKSRPNTSPIYKYNLWDARVLDRRPASGTARVTGQQRQPASGDARETDPIIGMHYPDRTNNSSYQTEYMTKFHRLPMRHSRRV